jgi:hypothetical protein
VLAAHPAGHQRQAGLIGQPSDGSLGRQLAGRPAFGVTRGTLAPEIVKVPRGKRGALEGSFFARNCLNSSKSQGLASGWRTIGLEIVKHPWPSRVASASAPSRLEGAMQPPAGT